MATLFPGWNGSGLPENNNCAPRGPVSASGLRGARLLQGWQDDMLIKALLWRREFRSFTPGFGSNRFSAERQSALGSDSPKMAPYP